MLARVALDRDALLEPADDPARRLDVHEQLVRFLLRHGVIAGTRREDARALLGNLEDDNLRQLWQAVGDQLRWQETGEFATKGLCDLHDVAEFRAIWSGKADLALVEAARALEFGVPHGQAAHRDEEAQIEITRMDLFHRATTVRRMHDLAERNIARNEERVVIWVERFALLAQESLHVAVCDRYAGVRLARYYAVPSTMAHDAGLRWFLKQVGRGSTSYVHLLLGSTMDEHDDVLAAVRRLCGELVGTGVQDLKLTLVEGHRFGDIAHDRHVRFGRNAFFLGRGMEIFEEPRSRQDSGCGYLAYEMARGREKKLRDTAKKWSGWPTEQVLIEGGKSKSE